jgi:hypothetical protein
MDPYLEGELWQEFHSRFANQISLQLMPKVAPRYVALLGKRYVIDLSSATDGMNGSKSSRVIYPDVDVVHAAAQASSPVQQAEVVRIAEPLVEIASPMPEEVAQLSIEIRDVAQRRLVTVIEILSPANKYGEGKREYEQRRQALLQTSAHLLEIDLLRRGERITLLHEPPAAPYYVYLSRSQRRPMTQIWPLSLREPLPTVPVPLLRPDGDVPLDMQAAVNACFDLVGYERLLDYSVPPPPPEMDAEERAWVAELLAKGGG